MKQIEITYEKLMKLHDEFVIGTKKEKKNIEKEIAEFLAKDILEDVKRAYTQIINNWYASYSPSIYDRKETLKDTGKFILNGSKITIYASSDPMSGHRLDNDRLFKLTMLQGYHGGAWHNGTPMTDATVWMKYKMPVTDKIKMTQLVINDAAYETDYIQYLIPADAYLTAEAGDIEVSFTFVKLVQNDDESTTSYVRKTTSGIIHISPLASFDKYEPSEMLDEIDQRLLEMIALQKNMKELNESIYNGTYLLLRWKTCSMFV